LAFAENGNPLGQNKIHVKLYS